jgi:hypothetical protein
MLQCIVGGFALVAFTLVGVGLLINQGGLGLSPEDRQELVIQTSDDYVEVVVLILIAFLGVDFVFGIILLVGVIKERHKLVLSWIISNCIAVSLQVPFTVFIFLAIVTIDSYIGIITICVISVEMIVMVYCILIVRSYLWQENNSPFVKKNTKRTRKV